MMALAFLFVAIIWLMITYFLARFFTRGLNEKGKKGWIAGLAIWGLMWLPVFGDWPLMEYHYHKLCEEKAGLFQYKTLEQWREENPSTFAELTPYSLPENLHKKELTSTIEKKQYQLLDGTQLTLVHKKNGYRNIHIKRPTGETGSWLNQRFIYEVKEGEDRNIIKTEQKLIDVEKNEILVKKVDFRTNYPLLSLGTNKLSDYKFWMRKTSCFKKQDSYKWLALGQSFSDLFKQLSTINEYKSK